MTNQFQSIESVRDLFESALRSALSPLIDDYLPLVPTQHRGDLQQLLRAVEASRKLNGTDLQAAQPDSLVAANDLPTSSSISPSPIDGPLAETVVAGGSCCFLSADGNSISFVDQKLADEIDHDFQLGTIIHERYLLISVLGRGGMGSVLLARDQLLNRQVAMKVVAVRFERDQAAFQEALAREARLGASLNDAGIAAVYDFGIHAGKSFTIFEYVDGETLRQLLKRCRQLHLADVQRIICSMARSLDFAHSQGVIHRDLKPENICITKQGQPKILDFGIARDLRMDFQLEGFCGTPQYAAPEQAACSATDGRTDQYALGLLAWEMLAGRRVFEAANAHELLEMHRHTQPENLLSLCPDLSAKFGMAIHRTLQKDPAKRYATCQEFASALGGALQESTVAGLRHASTQQELRAVYLCHVGDDSLIASDMASQLEAKGYTTWYYQRDAKTSSPFLRQATQAIRNASAAVLLISPAALRSDEFADEISEASQYGRLLIPLLIGLTTEDFENHHPG